MVRWVVLAFLLVVGCRPEPRDRNLAAAIPVPGEPHGDPVSLRYKLAPGQLWSYDARANSTVISTTELFNVIAFQIEYRLDLRVDQVEADGTARVTLTFHDFDVRSQPRLERAELPELDGARIVWSLAPDGTVRETRFPDTSTLSPVSAAQLAALAAELEALFRLPGRPARLDDPWRFARELELALPHSSDALHFQARHEAWIDGLEQDRATVRLTTRLHEPAETLPASALLPGMTGTVQLSGEGLQAADVEFDVGRGMIASLRHRTSLETIAKFDGAPLEAVTDVSLSLTLR